MWECQYCGERFDEPLLRHTRNRIDQYISFDYANYVCPYCGEDSIEEVWESEPEEDEDAVCRVI